jgi:hypothetical protein
MGPRRNFARIATDSNRLPALHAVSYALEESLVVLIYRQISSGVLHSNGVPTPLRPVRKHDVSIPHAPNRSARFDGDVDREVTSSGIEAARQESIHRRADRER